MIIAICILALIGMIISFVKHLNEGKIDVNLIFPAILTIAVWDMSLSLAIITITITVLIGIIGVIKN